ncbi:2-dehydro-3-deoxygluconokinase [Solibacillus sp. R5-41]|uniref:sugar kinase n=1 Tax=Solibacillus sp. R5-41 TaxID=2048654 RepID=UPI000C127B9E|nr:sugar kinase [Solibacillus sp. R5-41]ATP40413.1 2-dehydro-3-deoxygluconokinase [Solibacillus sp. R5-41]
MEVITLGETMAVFTASQRGKMRYASSYKRSFAGAESNVAIALSNLNVQVSWISQLGEDELGHAIYAFMKGHSVDTSNVTFTTKAPTGLMLKENRSLGMTNVYYYRQNSAFAHIHKTQIDESLFTQAKILHITGITPLLSESAYEACMECVRLAQKHQMRIFFDPNIRMKLLTCGDQIARLKTLVMHCDFFMPNVHEAQFLFNITSADPKVILDKLASKIKATIILKDGTRGTYFVSPEESGYVEAFQVDEVDAIGAGDAFAAGMIYSTLQNGSLRDSVLKGNAMGAMAVMAEGDIENLPTIDELDRFLKQTTGNDNVFR